MLKQIVKKSEPKLTLDNIRDFWKSLSKSSIPSDQLGQIARKARDKYFTYVNYKLLFETSAPKPQSFTKSYPEGFKKDLISLIKILKSQKYFDDMKPDYITPELI